MSHVITPLDDADVSAAARMWESGWHDAHADIVPPELVALRTSDSFVQRLRRHQKTARVHKARGQILGLSVTQADEVYQLYVAPAARQSGLAQSLLQDAETQLRRSGTTTAWLACSVGNARAARFYANCGWVNVGTEAIALETLTDHFTLDVWRFEKNLR